MTCEGPNACCEEWYDRGMHHAFIEKNRLFWSALLAAPVVHGDVLVEQSGIPVLTHDNAVYALLLHRSRGLRPVWLSRDAQQQEIFRSYVPSADFTWTTRLPLATRIRLGITVLWKFLPIVFTRNILAFSYGGIRYGDIAYDTYLSQERVGTVRRPDTILLWIFYEIARRHEEIRALLQGNPRYKAVLVSHQVGIRSGVMLRVALHLGYEGYLHFGHQHLVRMRTLSDVYEYPLRPNAEQIRTIIQTLGPALETLYEEMLGKQVAGKGTEDSQFAFSRENRQYTDRKVFCADFGLDPSKRNVFVMLHAMNDHPHSLFRGMLFRDYFDWFYQTFLYAKTDPSVNWIFKQHPSIRFYPTKDVSIPALFRDAPCNVVYIGEDRQIQTDSLRTCADCVVTCLGSAGFELPAMARIPSIVAGDNPYANLGFAREPRTRGEYFALLKKAGSLGLLNEVQQQAARAVYLSIYRFCKIPMTACPFLSFEKKRDPQQASWYWDSVLDRYEKQGALILTEMRENIAEVAKNDFHHLPSLAFSLQHVTHG